MTAHKIQASKQADTQPQPSPNNLDAIAEAYVTAHLAEHGSDATLRSHIRLAFIAGRNSGFSAMYAALAPLARKFADAEANRG